MKTKILDNEYKKEDSEKVLNSLREIYSYTFCPIINNICNQNCVCLFKGDILSNGDIVFPMCTHPIAENRMELEYDR